MNTIGIKIALVLAGFIGLVRSVAGETAAAPVLHLAIATHSEDTFHPETPDYSASKSSYTNSRNALIAFAQLMQARNIPWNWECDWNFLNAAYTNEVLSPDAALLAQTGGTNIVAWLRYTMGVETDPHSHELGGYNYADVAYLFTRLGVTPSSVVGGHIWDPSYATWQNWPRFTGSGLRGLRYTNYIWRPWLLMGAGTPQHVRDPVATGLWLPAATDAFFAHTNTGSIAAWGMWTEERFGELLDLLATNGVPTNRLWTAGIVFGQQDFIKPGYLTNLVAPMLDTLAALRDAERLRFVQFEQGLRIWTNQFSASGEVRQAPQDCVTFSLNIQDFSYPDLSATTLNRALDLHEETGVPVDVFLTTTMTDLYRSNYPALFNRLLTSSVAALSYHIRPPDPYYQNYDWLGLNAWMSGGQSNRVYSTVINYENRALDLIAGSTNNASGGYAQLRDLAGYKPYIVGALSDAPLQGAVYSAFRNLGARLAVVHGRMVNLTNRTRFGLYEKPEHFDLRLFETNWAGWIPDSILSNCLAAVHATNSAVPPYFVGVKMHDNDFFAEDSAWVTVYQQGPHVPPWTNALTTKSALLPPDEQTNMWNRYEAMVRHVAASRDRFYPVNARGILRLLGFGPQSLTLASACIAEAAPVGSEVGQFVATTNRTAVVTNTWWQLVSGPGDSDSSAFTISNSMLRTAAIFDHETQPFRFIRVRVTDTNAISNEHYFAVAVTNILTDDDDDDDHTEAQELVAGTDPLDASSVLRLQPPVRSGAETLLSWAAVPAKTYSVQYSKNLAGGWMDVPGATTNAAATSVTLRLPLAAEGASFYRLRVIAP